MTLEEIKAQAAKLPPPISSAGNTFAATLRPQRPSLGEHEALVAISREALPAWELAGQLATPYFFLLTRDRACMFDHLLTIGLLAITAGPSDFYARLLSRATALPGMPPQGPIDPRLLADTAHHAARAITDHVGHRLSEAERATIIERLWRATGLRRTPTFVARAETYTRLQQLARTQNVQVIWGDPQSHMIAGEVARGIAERRAQMGLLAVFNRSARFDDDFAAEAWQRVPVSAAASALFVSESGNEELTLAALQTRHATSEHRDGHVNVARALESWLMSGKVEVEAILRLLEEALRTPSPALLGPLFHYVDSHRTALAARVTEEGRALLSLCAAGDLHADDTSWRQLTTELLAAPEALQLYHANALAQRLGLF